MSPSRRQFLQALAAGLGVTAASPTLRCRDGGAWWEGELMSDPVYPAAGFEWLTHPPMRPLPVASDRPFDESGPDLYVAPNAGKGGNGSAGNPWGTAAQATAGATAGDTIYLRAGIHRGFGSFSKGGVTLRAYPGELAILDYGHQAFWDDPDTAWEAVPAADGGVEGEYRSTAEYPSPNVASSKRLTAGNFGDSMVPLFRYDFLTDLRSQNEYFFPELSNNQPNATGIYCGPGVYWKATSGGLGRFHIRLTHTTLSGLENNDYLDRGIANNNYTGETDPRNLQLVICAGSDLTLRGSGSTFQDLVVRGMNRVIIGGQRKNADTGLQVDGLHIFAGPPPWGVIVAGAAVHMTNCKIRGSSAPWTNRFTEKNRTDHGILAYIQAVSAQIDHTEFTDHHDGVAMSDPNLTVDFHHNLVENMNDDGLFLNPRHPTRTVRIWQNLFTGAVSYLAFTGGGSGVTSPDRVGCYVYRNLFDLRRRTYGGPPRGGGGSSMFRSGLLTNEHSDSVRPNLFFYHNDIALSHGNNQDWLMARLGDDYMEATFRVYNNILVQIMGRPRQEVRPIPSGTFDSRNNLLWGMRDGVAKTRPSEIYGDPKFVQLTADWRDGTDLHLQPGSPAIDAGFDIPPEWPDPLRSLDVGPPDVGAIPYGVSGEVFGPNADL